VDNEYLGFFLVFAGVLALGAAVVTVSLPGTAEAGLPGVGDDDSETRCDLDTKISVTGGIGSASIEPDSFRKDVTKSGVFNLNMAGSGQLSWFGPSDVELRFQLNGPIDGVENTVQIGDLGVTGSETVEFSASNLPPGHYVLHHNVYWDDGNDYRKEAIQITEGCR